MASSIVKSAAQQLGSLLVEEAKYLYKVSDKIEKLQIEMQWMECFLRDADTQQHREKLICLWVSQIRDLAYEAEDIIERYLHEVSHHRQNGIQNTLKWFSGILYTCDAYTLHNLGSEIDALTVKISELTSRLQTYGIQIIKPTNSLMYDTMVKEERRTYSHVGEEVVVGLKTNVQSVVDKLMNTDVKVVSVSGIGGLGKTTLARQVFMEKDVKAYFNNTCVWVYISKQFERDNVFREILIGLYDKDEGARREVKSLASEELPGKISEVLQNKKCLVVLDDIWTVDAWESLRPAFTSIGSSASKLLLTTRNQGLLNHVDSNGYSPPLNYLSEDDSWKLLQLKAFPQKWNTAAEPSSPGQNEMGQHVQVDDDDVGTKMEKLGREMLKHCHGLPLAIVTLGGILANKKTLAEWENVQKNISSYLMTDMSTDGSKKGGILRVLDLSYQDLPFYLKPCFLYLATFPEDYEIPTERLYQLWQAEGILTVPMEDDTNEVEGVTSYEIGEGYLLDLIQRSMVQVGKRRRTGSVKTCRVHDIMRDMCMKKCKEVSFLNVQELDDLDLASVFGGGCSSKKNMRRCAFHVKGKVVDSRSAQHRGKPPCVRALSVYAFRSIKEVIIKREVLRKLQKLFPLLRVLDLHNTSIDLNFRRLIHLRYLSFSDVVDWKPMLNLRFVELKYLVTLNLNDISRIQFLPNEFHKMERLRHLYLPRDFEVKGGGRLSFKVHQIETLRNFNLRNCQIEDLLQMRSLRIFSISFTSSFSHRHELEVLAESPVIKSGHLFNSVGIPIKLDVIGENPTILTSLFCKDTTIIGKLILHGDFDSSKVEYPNLDSTIASGIEVFPQTLRKVHIWYSILDGQLISALEKLPHLRNLQLINITNFVGNRISFAPASFQQLKTLTFECLNGLEEWEVGDGALPNLQLLRIYFCEKLKQIPDGLPRSIRIECIPCIKGIENYNICPYQNAPENKVAAE